MGNRFFGLPGAARAGLAAALAAFAAHPVLAADAITRPTRVPFTQINAGDTAWMISASALVLLMTVPGLALFYAGMVRRKNTLATMAQSFVICALVSVLWFVAGYSLAFMPGSPWLGDLSSLFMQTISYDKVASLVSVHHLAPTVPESVFSMFQLTFAIITPALITGAFAERMRFSALLVFMAAWALLVYAPIAHWVWEPTGWLASRGILDFAGGTVVHVNAGVAGLVAITPAAGFVTPTSALLIGAVAGVACYWGATGLKRLLGADDSLDVFGVHGVGGAIGALLTGVFAVPAIGGVSGSVATQALGVGATMAYSGLATAAILWIVDKVIGLRVDPEQEEVGLDQSLHGERLE